LLCTIKFIDTGNKLKYDYTQRGMDCKDVWVSKCGKKERKKLIKSRQQQFRVLSSVIERLRIKSTLQSTHQKQP